MEGLQQVLESSPDWPLAATGMGSGWRCLEAGRGAGSVAECLCERVDSRGSLMVTHLDTGFFDKLALPHLEMPPDGVGLEPWLEAAGMTR